MFEISLQPAPTTAGHISLILVSGFLMFARVVVGETYDRRNEGQVSFIVLYIICVTGRVVVGETCDQ